ncbi:Protein of unknown function [Streptococcus thermophilus]|nr:Protein of unknown function [Streptococcus thermophilus]
MKMNQKEK